MTVLITMAGMGSRFSREGYIVPKYKVRARRRTLFEWSMLSLQEFFDQRFVFATLANEDHEWLTAMAASMGIKVTAAYPRDVLSSGQAETAFDALSSVDLDEPLWIYNIDTYVVNGMRPSDMSGYDGCVHVFHSTDPGMSFVHYDESGAVDALAEKRVISTWATVGMYGFASAAVYAEAYKKSYEQAGIGTVRGERYIAPMYELMLRQGSRLTAPKLELADVHILGTPAQVLAFDASALPPIGNPA